MAAPSTDYDSPWKEALEHYLPDFLRLILPDLHTQIDWTYPPIFLDKELQAITWDAATSRRIVDKLVLVRLRRIGQSDCLLLIHIEVQGGQVIAAALMRMGERMYRYFYRISDRLLQAHVRRGSTRITQRLVNRGCKNHKSKACAANSLGATSAADTAGTIASHSSADAVSDVELFGLCVLTASTGGASTLSYQQGFGGHGVQFSCPVVHLAEWLRRWGELETLAKTNPFAVVVMAQLMAQQTHGNGAERLASKTCVIRLLYEYKYSRGDVFQLIRLIDWMIQLPAALEPLFREAVERIEQENRMAFVTSFERLGERRGRHVGRVEGEAILLQRQLTRKFGILSDVIQQRIQSATAAQLETWSLNILDAGTLDEVFAD